MNLPKLQLPLVVNVKLAVKLAVLFLFALLWVFTVAYLYRADQELRLQRMVVGSDNVAIIELKNRVATIEANEKLFVKVTPTPTKKPVKK